MLKKTSIIVVGCIALFGFGCETRVLRQDIPVSTNPLGAHMYVNGNLVGQTPGTVSLERTRNHILTLVKEKYRQEDVVITRQYQSDKVLMNAVLTGVDSGLFFKDKRMGVSSGLGSIHRQEASGEAYVLAPPAVSVTLIPLSDFSADSRGAGGFPAGSSGVAAPLPAAGAGVTAEGVAAAGIVAGAAVGAAQVKPIEKKWETSSSSHSYTKPDGTAVTRKSSSSVGVGVNPAGLIKALDTLFTR